MRSHVSNLLLRTLLRAQWVHFNGAELDVWFTHTPIYLCPFPPSSLSNVRIIRGSNPKEGGGEICLPPFSSLLCFVFASRSLDVPLDPNNTMESPPPRPFPSPTFPSFFSRNTSLTKRCRAILTNPSKNIIHLCPFSLSLLPYFFLRIQPTVVKDKEMSSCASIALFHTLYTFLQCLCGLAYVRAHALKLGREEEVCPLYLPPSIDCFLFFVPCYCWAQFARSGASRVRCGCLASFHSIHVHLLPRCIVAQCT